MEIKCIICDKVIPYAAQSRKFCRGGDCRALFNMLKRCWIKKDTSDLTKEEKKLYKQLVDDDEFKNSFHIKKSDKPFKTWYL